MPERGANPQAQVRQAFGVTTTPWPSPPTMGATLPGYAMTNKSMQNKLLCTLFYSVRQIPLTLLIDNTPIEQISNTKLLVIHIDSSLIWDVQVSHVKKIVIYKLFLLKRIRHFPPKDTRILFYNFYIKPYLEYCCSIWGDCSKENINIIVTLQKSVTI